MKCGKRAEGLPWAGTAVALGGLFFLDPRRLLPAFGAAVAVHELGHFGVLLALGTPPLALRGDLGGLRMEVGLLPWPTELAGAMAGPGASLLFAWLLEARWPLGAAVSQFLGIWNLLPLLPLDGGRAISALLTGFGPPGWDAVWDRLSPWLLVPLGLLAVAAMKTKGPLPMLLAASLALRVLGA